MADPTGCCGERCKITEPCQPRRGILAEQSGNQQGADRSGTDDKLADSTGQSKWQERQEFYGNHEAKKIIKCADYFGGYWVFQHFVTKPGSFIHVGDSGRNNANKAKFGLARILENNAS